MCQKPLTPDERKHLESQGAFYGNRSHILEQHIFEGQLPYFTKLIVGGQAFLTKPKLLEQLAEEQLVELKTVREVLGSTKFVISTRRQDSKCVLITPRELGLTDVSSLANIYEAAALHELALLSKDAAAYAALQFKRDWTNYAMVIVASQSVPYKGQEYLFALLNGIVLQVVGGRHDEKYSPGQPFLFRRG